jgi:hypothetical protein
MELTARVGDGDRQAAFLFWVSIASSPSAGQSRLAYDLCN